MPVVTTRRLLGLVVGGAAACAYAWWATGLAPFTTTATVAVAVPVLGFGVAAVATWPSRGAPPPWPGWARAWPWAVLVVLAVGLEVVGLALGGRSAGVPTLSTVVDRALAWLAVAAAGLWRAGHRTLTGVP